MSVSNTKKIGDDTVAGTALDVGIHYILSDAEGAWFSWGTFTEEILIEEKTSMLII